MNLLDVFVLQQSFRQKIHYFFTTSGSILDLLFLTSQCRGVFSQVHLCFKQISFDALDKNQNQTILFIHKILLSGQFWTPSDQS